MNVFQQMATQHQYLKTLAERDRPDEAPVLQYNMFHPVTVDSSQYYVFIFEKNPCIVGVLSAKHADTAQSSYFPPVKLRGDLNLEFRRE